MKLNTRARAALKPGGFAVAVDFLPDDERRAQVLPLLFSLTMLVWTPAGDTFTPSQYREMFERAGFTSVEVIEPPGAPEGFVIAR